MRDWLKNLRIENGLTMRDMGEKLCISESYYSMIESGDRQKKMDLTVVSGIASIFGIPIAQVVELEKAREQNST